MTLHGSFGEFGLDALWQWLKDAELPFMFERSLRLQPGVVEDRRALYSVPCKAIGENGLPEVLQICRSMSSPDSHLASIGRFFSASGFVHFGFECSGDVRIGKCYLELPGDRSEAGRLQFLGFKWSVDDGSVAVISRYRTMAVTSRPQLMHTMQQQAPASFRPSLSRILDECLPVANPDVLSELHLLEVAEEGSNRRSYDLNVYALERRVAHVVESVRTVASAWNSDSAALESWITNNRDATIGHIAMGLSRCGLPFATIYHSADAARLWP